MKEKEQAKRVYSSEQVGSAVKDNVLGADVC